MSAHFSDYDVTNRSTGGTGPHIDEQVTIDPPTYQGPKEENINPPPGVPEVFFNLSPRVAGKISSLPADAFKLVALTCLYFWAALVSHGILWYRSIEDPFITSLLAQAKERAKIKTGSNFDTFNLDPIWFDQFVYDAYEYLREYVRLIVRDTYSLGQWDLLSSVPNNAMSYGISLLLSSYSFSKAGLQGLIGTHSVLERLCFFVYCHPEVGIAHAVDFFGVAITPRLVASLAALLYSALQEYQKGYYSKARTFNGGAYDRIIADMKRQMSTRQMNIWKNWHENIMQAQYNMNAGSRSASVHEPPPSSSASLQEGSFHEAIEPPPSTHVIQGAPGTTYRYPPRQNPHQNLAPYPDPSDQSLRRNRIRTQMSEDERAGLAQQPVLGQGFQDRSGGHLAGPQVSQGGHSQGGVELRHPYPVVMPHSQQHSQPSTADQPSVSSTYQPTAIPALPRTMTAQPSTQDIYSQIAARGLIGSENRPIPPQGAPPASSGLHPPPQVGDVGRTSEAPQHSAADAAGNFFGYWDTDSSSAPLTGYYHEHAPANDNEERGEGWGGPSRGRDPNIFSQPVYKTMPRNG